MSAGSKLMAAAHATGRVKAMLLEDGKKELDADVRRTVPQNPGDQGWGSRTAAQAAQEPKAKDAITGTNTKATADRLANAIIAAGWG